MSVYISVEPLRCNAAQARFPVEPADLHYRAERIVTGVMNIDMVSGVPGEESQDVGRDGLLEAKRWLNMTTRVASIWTHRDKPMSELLVFTWPHGDSSFSFDVGGQFRGDPLDRQSFVAEVKNYKNEGDLPAHYRDFLAKAYVAWRAHPDRCVNRPGSDGGSQSMEDESHVSTQEVRRRAACARDSDGG